MSELIYVSILLWSRAPPLVAVDNSGSIETVQSNGSVPDDDKVVKEPAENEVTEAGNGDEAPRRGRWDKTEAVMYVLML